MSMRRHSALAAAILLLTFSAAATVARVQYSEGQVIEIKGAVTNANGVAQAGKTVIFEAYRKGFGLRNLNPRQLGRNKRGLVERTTTTDEQGRYAFEWPWHDYYNRFELSLGAFDATGFVIQEKIDISQRIRRGSPLIVSFVTGGETGAAAGPATPVPDSAATASSVAMNSPQATVGSGSQVQDEIRAREGAPGAIDTLDLPYGREVTWWYFERGVAYRFLDGELRDELEFAPVPSS